MVDEIQKELPKGTRIEVVRDGGKNAQNSLNNVIESLVLGAVLTIFVVYAFLNSWRSTLITALSLPTSVLAAFIAVWLCGFTLNFMTLLGLSLAIGVLIDDAIVVRENIVRHMENGSDRRTAALNGTAEIGMAVASTTFSIMAVFIPVAFMPGVSGEWFRPFALTVTASVAVSLFISFTLDPMLSAFWGDPPGYHHMPEEGHVEGAGQVQRLVRPPGRPLRPRDRLGAAPPQVDGRDRDRDLRRRDRPAHEVRRLVLPAEVRPAEHRDRRAHAAIVLGRVCAPEDGEGGRDRPFDQGNQGNQQRHQRQRRPHLRRHRQAHRAQAFRRRDRDRAAREDQAPGRRRVRGPGRPEQRRRQAGAGRVHRPGFAQADGIDHAYMEKLRQVPGAVDVGLSQQDPKDELQIVLDRGLANSMGISVGDAANALRVAFAGIEVGDWVDPTGETRDVAVRLHPDDRVATENIERLPIAVSGSNMMVPLDQIARITMGKGPSTIEHKDGKRIIAVSPTCRAARTVKSPKTP
jgi:multidrug efflux pump subunit AcrB